MHPMSDRALNHALIFILILYILIDLSQYFLPQGFPTKLCF